MPQSDLYRVKEFADLAGVTVRTLQYYDREGLLKPSQYTEARHRLYRQEDLLRLQQILTLKYMGFSLEEIRRVLTDPNYDFRTSLQIQQEALTRRIAQLQQVAQALEQTLSLLDSMEPTDLAPDLICQLIQGVVAADKWRWVERYYTPEQRETLAALQQQVSPQQMLAWQQQWTDLIAAFQAQRQQGRLPDDPELQPLAAGMHELIQAFTQGDPAIEQALATAYQDAEQWPEQQRPFDAELQRFMNQALTCYRERMYTHGACNRSRNH